MKYLTIASLAFVIALCACSEKNEHIANNPADPDGANYVGHDVRPPDDPTNWPTVKITGAPVPPAYAKVNSDVTYYGVASDFNPTGIEPGRIIRYDWDFGDGTVLPDTTGTVVYRYVETGEWFVSLRVMDNDSNVVVATHETLVTRGHVPWVHAGGPYTVKINSPLYLLGIASDRDGEIVRYQWDFDGDGVVDWESDTTGVAVHTYAKTGDYNARFMAMDDDSNTTTAVVEVQVTNLAPEVSFDDPYYVVKIYVPLTLRGRAMDPDGEVVRYQWDFDGDGDHDWESSETGVATHTYNAGGDLSAKLTATDDDGNTTTEAVAVSVTNYRPTADAGGPYSGKIHTEIQFSGHASDKDGTIVLYEWDFDGDRTYDWNSTSTGAASWTFDSSGEFTAWLRVKDDVGNTTTSLATVTVTDLTPTIDAPGPVLASVGVLVTVSATATDDGEIVLYEWDFDGDGTYDWSSQTSSTATHTYDAVGKHSATVRVTDDDGHVSVTSVTVIVSPINPAAVSIASVLGGYAGHVNTVAFSPDGEYVAAGTGYPDNAIRIWSVGDWSLLRTYTGHTGSVYGLAWSPDGQLIISGGADNIGRIWRVSDGVQVGSLVGHTDWINSVDVSPDGQYVVTGSWDNTAKVWNLSDGSLVRTLTGHTGSINAVSISPGGGSLVTASSDGWIRRWAMAAGTQGRGFEYHSSVTSIRWLPNGQQFAAGMADGFFKILSIWSGSSVCYKATGSAVRSVVASPYGEYVLTGGDAGSVKIWSALDGELIREIQCHDSPIYSIDLNADSRWLVTGGRDGTAKVWSISNQ